MSAASRKHTCPKPVWAALEAIRRGETADATESETLEFKEDPTFNPRSTNPQQAVIDKIIEAAVCLANGTHAPTYIVVGVADKIPGVTAIKGTDINPTQLHHTIANKTQPPLTVHIQPLNYCDRRLLIIEIPATTSCHSTADGKILRREGAQCIRLNNNEDKQ
ncbi:MAG: ATP-binding protein [Corynebacterium sp.]|uniref:AlbA family DNA-binding domain-containing protein n=1 Tax=Corynebacterium sp. TaxID=1720 RepID=UPI0026DB0759|nr:ATP-binding protein [Corynebacterium sp.]MDO4761166.1 ATP-binding protein [Corynebacterium sp.]